jgi:hypothetical protein
MAYRKEKNTISSSILVPLGEIIRFARYFSPQLVNEVIEYDSTLIATFLSVVLKNFQQLLD